MYEDVGYFKNFHYAGTGTEQVYLHRLLYHQAPTFFLAQKPKSEASALRASWDRCLIIAIIVFEGFSDQNKGEEIIPSKT